MLHLENGEVPEAFAARDGGVEGDLACPMGFGDDQRLEAAAVGW